MSEQTVDVVKKLYEGLEKADIEAVVALFDPSVEIVTPKALPWSTGHYAGLDGAVAYFTGALELLEDTHFKVEEIHADGEWAAALGDWTGRFRANGGEFDVRFVHFWQLREGLIIRTEGISDTDGIVKAHEQGS